MTQASVPLVIGIPCLETGRWSSFWACVNDLERPAGAIVKTCRGASPADNRNRLIEYTLSVGAQWLFWLDDDLTFGPDVLMKLLAIGTKGYPALVGLSLNRRFPFQPLWFGRNDPDPSALLSELPDPDRLVPIAGSTFGGLLIRTDVLRRMTPPWTTIGQVVNPEQWNDDLYFCRKLADEGHVQLYGVPSVRFGHTCNIELWPHYEAGEWSRVLVRGTQPFAALPWREETATKPTTPDQNRPLPTKTDTKPADDVETVPV